MKRMGISLLVLLSISLLSSGCTRRSTQEIMRYCERPRFESSVVAACAEMRQAEALENIAAHMHLLETKEELIEALDTLEYKVKKEKGRVK
jgi:hypothetical protein